MKRILVLSSIFGLLIGTTGWAGSLTVPNTFQGGQKALASEVNANFDSVEAEVDDNAANISSNASSITDIKGQLPNINALTLEGRPASDFADSHHIHDSGDLLDGGVHNINITGRAAVAGTADTLDGFDSSDFAESSHSHLGFDDLLPGVYPISGRSFAGNYQSTVQPYTTLNETYKNEGLNIPFKCYIDYLEAKIYDDTSSYHVEIDLRDASGNPILSASSTDVFDSGDAVITSSTSTFYYDPSTADPYYISAIMPNSSSSIGRLFWVKIYYTPL